MADKPVIIIKKIKKGGHGGHHGGAWKVAYADFVTAMMAFFLLLWLLSVSSKDKLRGIADYFAPTVGLRGQMGVGVKGGANYNMQDGVSISSRGSDSIIYGAPTTGKIEDMPKATSLIDTKDDENFSSIMKELQDEIKNQNSLKEFSNNIQVEMTPEGLRIQILDDQNRPMFKPDTSEIEPYLKKILAELGRILRTMPNYVSIAGHTRDNMSNNALVKIDSEPDKWMLSVARANSARAFLSDGYVNPEQILRIEGKGDNEPLDEEKRDSTKNIRLSITMLKTSLVSKLKQPLPINLNQ